MNTLFKKGHTPWNKDKKIIIPEEQRVKMIEGIKKSWKTRSRVFSEDHCKKLSKCQIGKKRARHPEESILRTALKNTGKKRTVESILKMKISHLGKRMGKESWNWIADRTKLKTDRNKAYDTKYKYWMLSVKKRDGWICRIADINCDGKLESHHILPWSKFPELRYQINNGITLCHAHHPRKQNDVQKLSPYFQRLVASLD